MKAYVVFNYLTILCFLFQILHHCLSGTAVAYSLFSGEAQLYTYMVLISEVTTPEINLRWYLDIAGLKRSKAYLVNGVAIFFAYRQRPLPELRNSRRRKKKTLPWKRRRSLWRVEPQRSRQSKGGRRKLAQAVLANIIRHFKLHCLV